MSSIGAPLENVPHQDMLSILFAANDVPENTVVWKCGDTGGHCITKARARTLVKRLAHGYIKAGIVQPGKADPDKVIVLSENQPIGFVNVLGIIAAGGVIATCPWQATSQELFFRVQILRPKAVICSPKTRALAIATREANKDNWYSIIVQDSSSMSIENEDGATYISEQEQPWATTWTKEIATRPGVIVFSSGTTGRPKGVCISHKNIISMIYQLRHHFSSFLSRKGSIPKMAGILDAAHVAGLFIHVFCPLGVGIEDIIVPGADVDLLIQTYNKYPIDIQFSVPTVLTRLLAHKDFPLVDFKNMKFICTGAAKTTVQTQHAITKALPSGTYCQEAWGMTELTFLATMHPPGVRGPPESVGKPLLGNLIQIRDPSGQVVQYGQTGEIYVSGPTVTSGYFLAKQIDHDSKSGEWLRTGDIGWIDRKGYLYVTGRNKDLIKYNGTQISPYELEEIIRKHPAVLEVAVVGTQLNDGNELPTAFVVLVPDAGEQKWKEIEYSVNNQVSPYKRLRGGIYPVKEIPKNPMGKISYQDVRELAQRLWQETQPIKSARL